MGCPVPSRLLVVDLSAGETAWEPVPDAWTRQFLGGKGLGARYLYDAIGPDTDPLGPENVLLFLVGPLTGYLPDGGRFAAVTKSPLTGLFLDSYAGGSFGPALRAQYPRTAGIVVTGNAPELTTLDLRDGDPQLRSAADLAGAGTDRADQAYPDDAVLAIGPAGEHEVVYATIAADGGEHHAGRGGAGAVMGAKGLKAVVVESGHPEIPPSLEPLRDETREAFAASPYGQAYRAAGTLESVEFADELEMLSTRGWQERSFDGATDLGADAIEATAEGREADDTIFPGDFRVAVDEYETVIRGGTPMALGAGLGVDDPEIVSSLGATCDRLGLDVISAGNAVALAILGSQEGAVERRLEFGDDEAIQELLEEIGTRSSDLGDVLAEGVEVAGDRLGLDRAIPTVKAMTLPSYDPRGAPAMALAYATSDRGACHRRAVPATVEAFREDWTPTQLAREVVAEQDRRALHWCLIVDDVTDPMVGDLGRRWLATFDLDLGGRELDRIGRRTWTMTRLINVREGVDRTADTLPELFQYGNDGIDAEIFERTLDRYYELREWDCRGRPSARLLDRLDLLEICDEDTPIGGPPLRTPASGGA